MRLWLLGAFGFAAVLGCSSNDTPPTGSGSPTDRGTGSNTGDDAQPGKVDDTPGTPGAQSKVTTTTETIDVDGKARQYVLAVPKSYDANRAYPLILALHGDGGTAASFAAGSNLDREAGDDAIVAYPDQSVDLFTAYDQNVDQKLLERIVTALKAKYSIDGTKIWGYGYSKGGYQLNEIACKKPGILTAMAIHAGGAPQTRDGNGAVNCPNAVGLATFVTHGQNDDPGGGQFGADYWATRAGCQNTRSPSTPSMCEAYDGCQPGKPVVFCVIPNGSHALYSGAAADSWSWFKTL